MVTEKHLRILFLFLPWVLSKTFSSSIKYIYKNDETLYAIRLVVSI
jgi:hypothetical protein